MTGLWVDCIHVGNGKHAFRRGTVESVKKSVDGDDDVDVQVDLVDTGETAVVPWSRVFKLPDEFVKVSVGVSRLMRDVELFMFEYMYY